MALKTDPNYVGGPLAILESGQCNIFHSSIRLDVTQGGLTFAGILNYCTVLIRWLVVLQVFAS